MLSADGLSWPSVSHPPKRRLVTSDASAESIVWNKFPRVRVRHGPRVEKPSRPAAGTRMDAPRFLDASAKRASMADMARPEVEHGRHGASAGGVRASCGRAGAACGRPGRDRRVRRGGVRARGHGLRAAADGAPAVARANRSRHPSLTRAACPSSPRFAPDGARAGPWATSGAGCFGFGRPQPVRPGAGPNVGRPDVCKKLNV